VSTQAPLAKRGPYDDRPISTRRKVADLWLHLECFIWNATDASLMCHTGSKISTDQRGHRRSNSKVASAVVLKWLTDDTGPSVGWLMWSTDAKVTSDQTNQVTED
jgi:hypothetical protein